jgi:hypothetical protein
MSKPRNLKVDLEICNRASKAPWRVATNKHPTTSGNSWGWVEGTRENWCWSNDNKKSYADARFIAQAREGWPHAIERAIEAEALARELAGMLIAVRRWVESTDVLGIVGKEGIEVHSDSVADAIDEMIIHAREVLGDEPSNDCRLI